MNRTDRLLAIVLELQGRGRQRAEDLAATFETSKRTIYRDIQALCESGVPIISVPGQGYSLMPGYFLPPLSFTTEEATMLLLGSDFMAQNFDAQYRNAAQSASRKIESVLPERLRDDVDYLQHNIRFISAGSSGSPAEHEKLQLLRRAIIERHTINFCYHTRHGHVKEGMQTSRDADPYGLIYLSNTWNLVAYCHLRQDRRNFRLDRMDNVTILPRTFQRSPAIKFQYDRERDHQRSIVVRALFDQTIARWVRENRFFFTTDIEETPQGLLVTLSVRQENDVVQWLLGWGRHVQVLEPLSLRRLLAEEATAMLHHYQDELEPQMSPDRQSG
jgi:predicted DNA-binding transcriptional regulator YafY